MLPKQRKEETEEKPRHFQKKLLGSSGKRRTLG
jgi:hypothetical protein